MLSVLHLDACSREARAFFRGKMRDGIVGHMAVHYLSVAEAAERAHLSVNTVRFYIRKGLFPPHSVTVGRARGYDEAVIDQWIAERTPY